MVQALWGKNGLNALSDDCAKANNAAYDRRNVQFPQIVLD